MDNRYEVFCLADPHFYESLDRLSATPSGGAPAGLGGSGARQRTGTEPAGAGPLFDTARREVPAGWRTLRNGDWLHVDPEHSVDRYAMQGWKIHVSATLRNADKIAAEVWDYCVPRDIPFKFVPSAQLLHLRNSKYAGRDTSGKFVTVYPADEEHLKVILEELGDLLDGEDGPYILTDLRWREGPLYVRYGAFAKRYCVGPHGTLVPAVENAEGVLVPDDRSPAFHVPDWVTLPDVLAPHLAARNATTVADLPYRIEKALHFSNGGGVYAGTDLRTGEQVVLKEARPHAGLAADGADAVARLERERDALERLAGTGVAPAVRDWFTIGDHRFLVMDFLDGKPLNSFFGHRHPLLAPEPDPRAVEDYTAWALRIHAAVEKAVAAVHERGVVFNDLHMFNIMVGPDEESVALLDFEAAAAASDNARQSVAHPGFVAPPDRRGTAVDHYALACLRLALFLPATTLLAIDRSKAAHLAEVIAAEFPVPLDFLAEAVAEITGEGRRVPVAAGVGSEGAASASVATTASVPAAAGSTAAVTGPRASTASVPTTAGSTSAATAVVPAPVAPAASGSGPATSAASLVRVPARYLPADPVDWPGARDAMATAIMASATPDRTDRLFPGDIAQFADGGGLGLAHGAAGVLYAFAAAGLPRYEEGERWLLRRLDPPPHGIGLGLYDGVAGIAWTLDRLGHTDRAVDLMHTLLAENWRHLASDLYGGLAGIGLVLDHLGRTTGDTELRDRALEAAGIVAGRLSAPPGTAARRAGLMRGATGPALLFLRLYEHTRAPALLGHAARALQLDLDSCVTTASGSLEVDEGWRTMPYVGDGSAGIGLVLDDYLALSAGSAKGSDSVTAPLNGHSTASPHSVGASSNGHPVTSPDPAGGDPGAVGRFEEARVAIVRAATSRLYAQPSLFAGRAGMILHLARTTAPVPSGALAAQTGALGWYGIPYAGGLAFPGHQMMRLSMDLATGTAGCLLALAAARDDHRARLPFLPPLTGGS
ncbi:class III lanthionine synthetase LanKC [Actinacidiphila acididurans]|uniref:non-specific serine/threonine protein kinase n=1 Tax=Actinacidiphila acididurans TaxID=2784346 RepID=A0ABS2U4V8_9ACTN|nr:class III lanthionine synthetase LanKC [Actinacidiphila acididurans]MBM9510645.1 class III lanthionine synthetase LanKC [Actinacidiphila acididurans]